MTIKYISASEIIKIHDKIIETTGGHFGIISFGNLDFIVSQMEVPKSLERKATILFYGILTKHPFLDGNKRIALESMKTFLFLNDKKFIAPEDDIWNCLHLISEGKLKFEEAVNWIKQNMSD